jgi:predicted esterase
MSQTQIHEGQPVIGYGPALESASAAMILLHGRGSSARDILSFAMSFNWAAAQRFAYLAPQAAGNQWYPFRFIEPVERNEPHLTSALNMVQDTVAQVKTVGVPLDRIVLLGFSQGACLALEYAARNPGRWGAVIGLSGGLIGQTLPTYTGDLAQTPVFLGCSDVDAHIPLARVHASADVFAGLNAAVEKRIYRNMGHTINDDEVTYIQQQMEALVT